MGILSIIATPIGNMEDITLRALRTLREADVIYAEDTRVTSKILAKYGFTKPLFRLDAATEDKKADEIIARLEAGECVAYVSDAGTPGISDPGARLVARVRTVLGGDTGEKLFATRTTGGSAKSFSPVSPQMKIEAIPGPSALTTALSIAGIDVSRFTFLGFLPHKKGRQTALKEIARPPAGGEHPVVLYESPHRIIKLLQELNIYAPHKRVTIGRELTKMHEEVIAGTPQELAEYFAKKEPRGEFVVIVHNQ